MAFTVTAYLYYDFQLIARRHRKEALQRVVSRELCFDRKALRVRGVVEEDRIVLGLVTHSVVGSRIDYELVVAHALLYLNRSLCKQSHQGNLLAQPFQAKMTPNTQAYYRRAGRVRLYFTALIANPGPRRAVSETAFGEVSAPRVSPIRKLARESSWNTRQAFLARNPLRAGQTRSRSSSEQNAFQRIRS